MGLGTRPQVSCVLAFDASAKHGCSRAGMLLLALISSSSGSKLSMPCIDVHLLMQLSPSA
jgi:hypothetical protein